MPSVTNPSSTSKGENQAPGVIPLHIRFYSRNGEWYAECLDLDLLTARASIPDAYRELLTEIELYLQSARESGTWDRFFPRPAPFSHWLRYYAASVLGEIRGRLLHSGNSSTFSLPFNQFGRPLGA